MNSNFENQKPFIGSPLESQSSKSLEAWSLGPKEENHEELKDLIVETLRDHAFWRPYSNTRENQKIKRILANNLQHMRSG